MFHIKKFSSHFLFIHTYYRIKIFTKNILNKFSRIESDWDLLIKHNKSQYSNTNNNQYSGIILCDVFSVVDWLFVNQIGLNYFAMKWQSKIVSYGYNSRTYSEDEIYKSFGCEDHLEIIIKNGSQLRDLKKFYSQARTTIKSKRDLLNYKLDGVHLGRDIYESIIRTGLPTISINDFITWEHIFKGISFFIIFNEYFKKKKVNALFLSHDMYIHMGIVSKVGFKFNIPTYLLSDHNFIKLTYPYELHNRFKMYPVIFDEELSESEKVKALNWSKRTLNRRLDGEVGVQMAYQKESAFTNETVPTQINGNSLNVVIATHEFFDNPYAYGDLLFNDFYDWLDYLGNISIKLDYKFYLKAHRDANESEINHLKYFEKKFKNFILLNKNYTFHQIKEEGVKHVLTCYGSVGHELPLLGFTVINAGNNPHIAYDFNLHPKTIKEYEEILINLNNLNLKIDKNDVYEFFYVHNKISKNVNLNINDFVLNDENKINSYINNFHKFESKTLKLLKDVFID